MKISILSKMFYDFTLILRIIVFKDYSCRLTVIFSQYLEYCLSLLASVVAVEKSAVILIIISLGEGSFFSLLLRFLLPLVFCSFTVLFLGIELLIPLGYVVLLDLGIILNHSGKNTAIIFFFFLRL